MKRAERYTRALGLIGGLLLGGVASADVVDDALAGRVGQGTTGEGIAAVEEYLDKNAGDDRALFALGMLQTLHGWERVSQGLHKYGAGGPLQQAGGFILPLAGAIPPNPNPEEVTLEDVRAMFLEGMEHLSRADATLGKIDGDFVCRADILSIRLDFNGDGTASDNESVMGVLNATRVRVRNPETREAMSELWVDFDRGDAEWLRGYIDLSLAFDEFVLAHDYSELFDKAGHVVFPKPVNEYGFLHSGRSPFEEERMYTGGVDPLDLVAFIHLLRFPVSEPERLARTREHLLSAIGHSRAMWASYNAETDDGDEWIPNTGQSAALPGATIDEDMYNAWVGFLDASESILEGESLLPFWRGDGTQGVDVQMYFQDPCAFDFLLWFQGSSMKPYLKEGEVNDMQFWRDMESAFNRHSFRHMFWIN